jgi:hypothetical protein
LNVIYLILRLISFGFINLQDNVNLRKGRVLKLSAITRIYKHTLESYCENIQAYFLIIQDLEGVNYGTENTIREDNRIWRIFQYLGLKNDVTSTEYNETRNDFNTTAEAEALLH